MRELGDTTLDTPKIWGAPHFKVQYQVFYTRYYAYVKNRTHFKLFLLLYTLDVFYNREI